MSGKRTRISTHTTHATHVNTTTNSSVHGGLHVPLHTHTPATARSMKLSRRGLSSKFDDADTNSSGVKTMPTIEHAHDKVYHNWATRALNNIPVHRAMSTSMDRTNEVILTYLTVGVGSTLNVARQLSVCILYPVKCV